MTPDLPCACSLASASHSPFRPWRDLDWDTTDGRYADVEISQCITCDQLWLRYFVEYEAFTRSGRWARGRIDLETALRIQPDEAVDFLNALPSYLYGGSFFGGVAGERSGPMPWGI